MYLNRLTKLILMEFVLNLYGHFMMLWNIWFCLLHVHLNRIIVRMLCAAGTTNLTLTISNENCKFLDLVQSVFPSSICCSIHSFQNSGLVTSCANPFVPFWSRICTFYNSKTLGWHDSEWYVNGHELLSFHSLI